MHIQVLSSGSEGNSTLVRAGELSVLVDAGLGRTEMEARLATARLAPGAIEHVLVTHGHLDHARSAGIIARRERAMLHCPENMITHAAARRSKRLSAITVNKAFDLPSARGGDVVRATPVALPHDCDPTVAYKLEYEGRTAVILTDMGRPDSDIARQLADAHVLVLEFNYDPGLMTTGPYPFVLQKRITGDRGHLANEQGAKMLEMLASANLHTLVLAHLSAKTNTRDLALEAAHGALARLGLSSQVRVLVASQHEPLENLEV